MRQKISADAASGPRSDSLWTTASSYEADAAFPRLSNGVKFMVVGL
jgi:hypothetical protein